MDISSAEAVATSISCLTHEIATGILNHDARGFGSFTPAIYDTAWLAMVVRSIGNERQEPLFPQCFNYLIQEQRDDGSWESYHSPIDGILNSLAALLAIVKQVQRRSCSSAEKMLLQLRVQKTKVVISRLLNDWDVRQTCHVGFEILVPSLLRQLSGYDIHFEEYPGREMLYQLYDEKMKRFPFDLLYMKTQTTLLHSLEAFVGMVDFQRLSHHLTEGSMLGSPSSTAVYLMEAQEWDTEAEHYLRKVEQRWFGNGKQMGIPSAFPSSVFESSWAISTLLANGVAKESLPQRDLQAIIDFLSKTLSGQSGVTGFAPGFLADADDTAVTLLLLRQLDTSVSFKGLLETFSSAQNFRTYAHETSPSFSANCNVLIALLHASDVNSHGSYIKMAVDYLIAMAEDGPLKDKWNVSGIYSSMLLIRGLVGTIRAWDEGKLRELNSDMWEFRIPLVVFQASVKLMAEQANDGSWEGSVDRTAYGVLALAHALKLPWPEHLKAVIEAAIASGRNFLRQLSDADLQKPSYVWIEKVTYASPVLSRVYVLAAMQAPTSPLPWTDKTQISFETGSHRISPMTKLISKTPLFAQGLLSLPTLVTEEAALYLKRLGAVPVTSKTFPIKLSASNKYKTIVPLTWVACNHLNGFAMTSKQMWIMMILSDLIYQSDEYMESTVSSMSPEDQAKLEAFIRQQCGCQDLFLRSSFPAALITTEAYNSPDFINGTSSSATAGRSPLEAAKYVLHTFIAYVLQQPNLLSRPPWQKQVAQELCGFLLAHIRHVRDNARFSEQALSMSNEAGAVIDTFYDPQISYFEWIYTLAIDDTSCPFAFTFFLALLEEAEPLPTPYARYVAQTLCMHLGRMCRQYNDYGSLARDHEEKNLNSLNFPEFGGLELKEAKGQLMAMAELERQGVERALGALKGMVKEKVWRQVKAFVDVTDLYGQIYMLRDLTNRTK